MDPCRCDSRTITARRHTQTTPSRASSNEPSSRTWLSACPRDFKHPWGPHRHHAASDLVVLRSMVVACGGETAPRGSSVNSPFCAERESTPRRAAQGVRKSSPATPAISLGSFVASGFTATRGAGPFKVLGPGSERHSDETLHLLGQSTRLLSALGTLVHMPQKKGPDHQSNPARGANRKSGHPGHNTVSCIRQGSEGSILLPTRWC